MENDPHLFQPQVFPKCNLIFVSNVFIRMRYLIFLSIIGLACTSFAQTTSKKKNQAKKTTTTTTTSTKKSATTVPSTTKTTTTSTSSKSTTSSSVGSIVNSASSLLGSSALSETDIISGLKEALKVGASNASTQLNALDGFNKNLSIRIPFPPEVGKVATTLREYGYGSKVDEFELTLNRAAEQAAKDAAPIFVNAISQITITDAKNILQGPDNAATTFLQSKTTDALFTSFSPTIKTALGNTLATSKWTEITSLYNKLPFVTPVETDLVKYTTNRSLSGLFFVVAAEEKKIRDDPAARTSDILKKVFGSVSK